MTPDTGTFYRLWLRLLPERFRARFGEAMTSDFLDFHRASRAARPVTGGAYAWLVGITDLVSTAVRQRREDLFVSKRGDELKDAVDDADDGGLLPEHAQHVTVGGGW